MNLNQLQYFISLAETLSFTKAAAACFISQTAMTQQIKSLENTIGTPLFIRDKHHVELTAAGRVYLTEARSILVKSEAAMHMARLASEGVEGNIRLGYVSGYGPSVLTSHLQAFHKTNPYVKVSLFSDVSSVLHEVLAAGECDLIFTTAQRIHNNKDARFKYTRSHPLIAVLPSVHPLADRETLTLKDLEDEKFIMMEPASMPKTLMEEYMLIYERGGYYPKNIVSEPNPETLILMIAVGIGVSILPEYITRTYIRNEHIKYIPLMTEDGAPESIMMEVCWLDSNKNPVMRHVLNRINIEGIPVTPG